MKQFETFEGLDKVLVGHNVIIDVLISDPS